jgi:inner membrane protein
MTAAQIDAIMMEFIILREEVRMDPVTHAIIGTTISKLTGNGITLSTPENIAIVLASVLPDIDVVLKRWGDYVYLKNHRVATHSFLGLVISAGLITAALKLVFPGVNLLSMFLLTFAGGLSHTVFDILNSYGAKLLWPFFNKKMALNILVIMDPVLLVILAGYIFIKGVTGQVFILLLVTYILSRVYSRYRVKNELLKKYAPVLKVSVLPSMLGLYKWHFVLEKKNYTLIGEKNVINGKINIITKLKKIEGTDLEAALESPVGRFFRDFTPLYNISLETTDNIRRYTFTDLRYFVKNDFFHHAILELDKNGNIVKSTFNPYSMNRYSEIPINRSRRVLMRFEINEAEMGRS